MSRKTGAVSPDGLEALVQRANSARRRRSRLEDAGFREEGRTAVEEFLEELFGCSRRLAVYGSLLPGGDNHERVEGLGGDWIPGRVHGELFEEGWGADLGFPALRWKPGGDGTVEVQVLVSPALPRHWEELDVFEGPDYVRVLVPVWREDELVAVANLYEGR